MPFVSVTTRLVRVVHAETSWMARTSRAMTATQKLSVCVTTCQVNCYPMNEKGALRRPL